MIITLCGSARFEKHFKVWNEVLSLSGHVVFSLSVYPSDKGGKDWYTAADKTMLDTMHKKKIKASDAIMVLNVFGYIGESTMSEIDYASKFSVVPKKPFALSEIDYASKFSVVPKKFYALESWGKGLGICEMHTDEVQAACRNAIPIGYKGSPIDTTTKAGFLDIWDLLPEPGDLRNQLINYLHKQLDVYKGLKA